MPELNPLEKTVATLQHEIIFERGKGKEKDYEKIILLKWMIEVINENYHVEYMGNQLDKINPSDYKRGIIKPLPLKNDYSNPNF